MGGAIPIELFAEAMAEALRQDAHATFFVCSEDAAARRRLTAQFADRVLPRSTAAEADERYSTVGQQAALADLILLSRTSRLLGSRYSGFTYTAAAWGGIPLIEVGSDLPVNDAT